MKSMPFVANSIPSSSFSLLYIHTKPHLHFHSKLNSFLPSKPKTMSRYTQSPSDYGYAAPPPYYPTPYGGATTTPPHEQPNYGTPRPAIGNSFAAIVSSTFPKGTDPYVIACFQIADVDERGVIDDKELQRALSLYNQSFSIRTVRLLIYLFNNPHTRHIRPKEFTQMFYSLRNWRAKFHQFDRDQSGYIDAWELRETLMSLGFAVSDPVLDLLVSKFDKNGGNKKAIEYDNFIECCLILKGLTERFKEREVTYSGNAAFTYDDFILTVLPFLVI